MIGFTASALLAGTRDTWSRKQRDCGMTKMLEPQASRLRETAVAVQGSPVGMRTRGRERTRDTHRQMPKHGQKSECATATHATRRHAAPPRQRARTHLGPGRAGPPLRREAAAQLGGLGGRGQAVLPGCCRDPAEAGGGSGSGDARCVHDPQDVGRRDRRRRPTRSTRPHHASGAVRPLQGNLKRRRSPLRPVA